ncbi:MAG: ribonuclease H family protein [Candidatus Paceibacterota bacterium]
MPKKNNFYGYLLSTGEFGVCQSWSECEALVKGKNARFKGFPTKSEATEWLKKGAQYEPKKAPKLKKGIYFDAGTGRGHGVELKVTNEKGENLLPKKLVNTKHETHKPDGKELTNNFGELLAAKFALEIALKKKERSVFGDSQLILKFWSKGYIKKEKVAEETVQLSEKVTELRKSLKKQVVKWSLLAATTTQQTSASTDNPTHYPLTTNQ